MRGLPNAIHTSRLDLHAEHVPLGDHPQLLLLHPLDLVGILDELHHLRLLRVLLPPLGVFLAPRLLFLDCAFLLVLQSLRIELKTHLQLKYIKTKGVVLPAILDEPALSPL